MKATLVRLLSPAIGTALIAGFNLASIANAQDAIPPAVGQGAVKVEELSRKYYLPETHQFAPGDLIPQIFHIYLRPLPTRYMTNLDTPEGNVTIRQWGDLAYYLDPQSWEVLKVVELGSR